MESVVNVFPNGYSCPVVSGVSLVGDVYIVIKNFKFFVVDL